MFDNILIATDGSELARTAVTQGLALAKALGARVTAVMATEPWAATAPPEILTQAFVRDYEKAAAARVREILDVVAAAAKDAGVACSTLHVSDRFPAEGILEAAAGAGCDLIAMASHGRRGIARLLLGSQAMEVLTHSTVPVLICR